MVWEKLSKVNTDLITHYFSQHYTYLQYVENLLGSTRYICVTADLIISDVIQDDMFLLPYCFYDAASGIVVPVTVVQTDATLGIGKAAEYEKNIIEVTRDRKKVNLFPIHT